MGYKKNPKTGTWEAYYCKRHPVTRIPISLRRKGFKSEAEARREEAKMIVEIEDKLRAMQIPKWSAVLEEFAQDQAERGLSGRTIQNYGLCLKAHTLEEWGDRLIDQITPHDIRQLVQSRVGTKSSSSQQSLVKFIRSVFQFAVERGYVKVNPVPQFRFKLVEKVKRVLTEEQAGTLLTKAKVLGSEWYPHWALAIYTGMRSGELYALTWDKVSFENRQIVVDQAWNSKDGFKSTKSGHDRIVPINDNLMHVLKELKLANEGGQFVLPRQGKWDKGEQARELQKFLILNGLPPVRFHDLRATWATILLSKGVEPVRVMKMGGWRDMKTMMIYTRMAGIDTRGATDCLDLHNPSAESAKVLKMGTRSDL
jgi:integrase